MSRAIMIRQRDKYPATPAETGHRSAGQYIQQSIAATSLGSLCPGTVQKGAEVKIGLWQGD
jgi:hypothetical protein